MKTRHLYDLIHSLSNGEKRLFTKELKSQNNSEIYVNILTYINRSKDFDDDRISKRIVFLAEKGSPHKNYKNALYNKLTAFLYTTHNNELFRAIVISENLLQRGLYKQANDMLEKAKKIAYEQESFHLLLEIIEQQAYIHKSKFHIYKADKLKDFAKEEEEVNKIIANLNNYKRLHNEAYLIIRKNRDIHNSPDLKKILSIKENILLTQEEMAMSLLAKFTRNSTNVIISLTLGNKEEFHKNSLRHFKFIESKLSLHTNFRSRYLMACNLVIHSCYVTKRFDDFERYFSKIKNFTPRNINEYNIYMENTCTSYFVYYTDLKKGTEKELKEYVEKLEKYLLDSKDKTNISFYMGAIHNLCRYFCLVNNFEKALYWNNVFLYQNAKGSNQHSWSFIEILRLIILYELGNFYALDKYIPSLKGALKRKKHFFSKEKILISFFEKVIPKQLSDPKYINKIFTILKEDWEKVPEKERTNTNFYPYMEWIESKINSC